MAYKINDACISCGACADVCPASCIKAGDDKYEIDEASCLDCGACCDSCPNDAIKPAE